MSRDTAIVISRVVPFLTSRRAINALGFAACIGMLGFGYVLQYVEGLEPCPLCILQRIAILGLAIVFLIAALHHPRSGGAKVYGLLLLLTAGIGASLSARQIYLQYFLPKDAEPACASLGLDYMLEVFSPIEVITTILKGTGDCAEVVWTFLGLSIPSWTLVCFVFLGSVGVVRNFMRD